MHHRPVMAVACLKPTPRARPGHPRIVPRSRRVRPLPAEVVFQPDDVVELRGRDLDQLAALDRLEPVDPPGRDPAMLAWTELGLADDAGLVLQVQAQPAGADQD